MLENYALISSLVQVPGSRTLPVGPTTSLHSQLAAAPLGAFLRAQPCLSSKSPQGSPIIIPLLHWGKCHV
ncbi:hypothetical protein Celaphus_00004936 [Cervus elaphus hippelaphus]|uniref:Uncharacterized protein n=1 Tax=Cervus elaphus hippelaphus TaxID=46360 RepID=A0A212DD95_CEREH|nr:hypothetical protein Celaphus_00004936 [Cervus elaphus hippelaphus]